MTGMIDIRDYGLKPCPLCGSTDLSCFFEPYLLPLSRGACFDIKLQCRCGLSFERDCISSDEFIKAWNTRGENNG